MVEYLVMLSLLLHLYQPSYQDKQIFKRIADECYIPLIRFLKNNKNFKVTLNTPLSLLELLDKYGYNSLISDMHVLLDRKQIELVGCGAYHPLLTKIPGPLAEKEIILNEYGLGYYFGRRQGFEGENAILISDINGFFPPELAVNNDVLGILDSLGYRWVVVDQTAVLNEEPSSVYSFPNLSIKVLARNAQLSNMLAFARSSVIDGLSEALLSTNNHLLALDGETFGHHNKSGINLLYSIAEVLASINMTTATYSEYLNRSTYKEISGLSESTWSSIVKDSVIVNTYPLWESENNLIQTCQWLLLNTIIRTPLNTETMIQDDNYANKALWNVETVLATIKDPILSRDIIKEAALMKLLASDQFFWSSGVTLPLGEHLYDKVMLEKFLDHYSSFLNLLPAEELSHDISSQIEELRKMI